MVQIVARNKKTGTEYIFASIVPHAPHICRVSTAKAGGQTWLARTSTIEFITPVITSRLPRKHEGDQLK